MITLEWAVHLLCTLERAFIMEQTTMPVELLSCFTLLNYSNRRNTRETTTFLLPFTGEEKGLYGSNYYLKNPPDYLKTMNYMLNFDMVGRLNEEKVMVINGVGTSPVWKSALSRMDTSKVKFVTTESGVGPSDHTSFYMKDIPAIHFFTGSHEDYHKPSDDADKVNYEGMYIISDFVYALIGDLNNKLKLAFTKTKDDSQGKHRGYKLSLGVVPDYMYSGKGMRIEGVKEGRPAAKAGIQAGDVVIGIGTVEVTDMKSYMTGLNSLEEGKSEKVKILRGTNEMEFDVQF